MRFQTIAIYFLTFISFGLCAQNMEEYTNGWEGKIEDTKTFSFTVEIEDLHSKNPILIISNSKRIIEQSFETSTNRLISIKIGENLSFEGALSDNSNEINGFIKSGLLLYHLKLTKIKTDSFVGIWNILMVDNL